MTRTAAFFDLDRTLLAGGSGPVFAAAFGELGVNTPHLPGQDLLFRFFDLVGESYLVMQLAKRASSRAKGLRRDDVARVGESAADVLLPKVQPYVASLLRSHREAGDLLVLATTSPYDLVAPLARRLGFDGVVATRYAEIEGTYTGDLDGGFVWGPGKLAAVKRWASENAVDMADSAAYSDSVFDAPLLAAVGRPTAVNPDYRLRALALVRRWPVRSLDAPVGVPSLNGTQPFDIVRQVTRPEFFPGVGFHFEGVANVPRTGGVIIAANHRSYFDPVALSLGLAKAGRNAQFLGKKEVFDAPVVGTIARAFGGIRVDRGTGSDAPIRAAAERLEAGECVVILPQGTIPRGEEFFDPILRGKTGVARLAALFPDVPVIPVGIWGTEVVWPRSSKVPNLLRVTDPPDVSITFGSAVRALSRNTRSETQLRADTERIMAAIMDALPPEALVAREVSVEELAKTTPDGRVPSASKSRPAAGTDARKTPTAAAKPAAAAKSPKPSKPRAKAAQIPGPTTTSAMRLDEAPSAEAPSAEAPSAERVSRTPTPSTNYATAALLATKAPKQRPSGTGKHNGNANSMAKTEKNKPKPKDKRAPEAKPVKDKKPARLERAATVSDPVAPPRRVPPTRRLNGTLAGREEPATASRQRA